MAGGEILRFAQDDNHEQFLSALRSMLRGDE